MSGNPRCDKCHGRGIVRTTNGYTTCVCVRGTQSQRDWQRYANAPLDHDRSKYIKPNREGRNG